MKLVSHFTFYSMSKMSKNQVHWATSLSIWSKGRNLYSKMWWWMDTLNCSDVNTSDFSVLRHNKQFPQFTSKQNQICLLPHKIEIYYPFHKMDCLSNKRIAKFIELGWWIFFWLIACLRIPVIFRSREKQIRYQIDEISTKMLKYSLKSTDFWCGVITMDERLKMQCDVNIKRKQQNTRHSTECKLSKYWHHTNVCASNA